MPDPGPVLEWQSPAVAFYLAPLLGLLAAGVTVWNLRRSPAPLRFGAGLVRAAAVVLAVLAVAGPRAMKETVRAGERLVATDAASAWASDADFAVVWPDDAPDAATALEGARAALDPARANDVLLDARNEDPGALERIVDALRDSPGNRLQVMRTVFRSAPGDEPLPAPRLVVPAGAVEGLPVRVELDAVAAPFAGGTARVLTETGEVQADLGAEEWRAVLPPLQFPAGTHRLIVEVEGRLPAAGFVDVAPSPRVTVLGEQGAELDRLLEAFRAQGLAAGVLDGGDLAPQLDATDVFVVAPGRLAGVMADRVAERVRGGAGVLAMGGPWPRGLVRLRRSPLAPLLPVTIPPPPPPKPKPPPPEEKEPPPEDPDKPKVRLDEGEKQALRVALLLCIDRSGSMAGNRMLMAKKAAIAAAGTLHEEDRVAVMAFDDQAKWVARFQSAKDLRSLTRRAAGLQAGGGTNFYPALKMSYEAIAKERCGIRHIILLTDGATRPGVFRPMVRQGIEDKTTLSTVAIGDGADLRLLGLLASWGKGRMYPATDPRRLPQVVTLDTDRFAGKVREERRKEFEEEVEGLPELPDAADKPEAGDPTAGGETDPNATEPPEEEEKGEPPRTPVLAARAAFLEGLEEAAWPALASPEDVEERAVSHVALRWEAGGPALALGRAGLGRVAVVAADLTSRRATDFWAWEPAPQVLAQLVRSLAPEPAAGADRPQVTLVRLADGTAAVHVDRAGGMLHLERVGGGSPLSVRCDEVSGAGFSLGSLDAMPQAGVWAGVYDRGRTPGAAPRVVAVSRGPAPPRGPQVVLEAAAAADAPVIDAPPERIPTPGAPRRQPVEAPFLLGAAALLLADAVLRRVVRTR